MSVGSSVLRDRREGASDSKTAKQERTINPDTRLHSDEMRETDEKRGSLQEIQGKGHDWGTSPSINDDRL